MLPDAKALQTHAARYCECPEGFEKSRNPRNGGCVRCGRLPYPLTTLPEHVRELFDVFADVAESAGIKSRDPVTDSDFEAFRTWTLARVHQGQAEYGERWRGRYMPGEAVEELYDCAAYAFAQMVKDGERSGDLFDAVTYAYRAFLAFRRYEARQKGSA